MVCMFLHVAGATTSKTNHGFYKTFSDEKVVSQAAMLNVSTGSITTGVIVCKLVTGIVADPKGFGVPFPPNLSLPYSEIFIHCFSP